MSVSKFTYKTFQSYNEIKDEIGYLELREYVLKNLNTRGNIEEELNSIHERLPELRKVLATIETKIEEFSKENDKQYQVLFLKIIKRKSYYQIASEVDYSVRHIQRIYTEFKRATKAVA
ncbi:hypothetical protein RI065_04295 [Mycoplasmatota bacterium zrk1]